MVEITDSISRRFWSYVDVRGPDECWPWKAKKSRGYGYLWVYGRMIQAHRISYRLHYGSIDLELDVMHTCDCRACENPKHLIQGSRLDNMHDMIAKGRYRGWNAAGK